LVVDWCDLLAGRTPCCVEVCDEVGVRVEKGAEVEWGGDLGRHCFFNLRLANLVAIVCDAVVLGSVDD
jgi:hypothetical protein